MTGDSCDLEYKQRGGWLSNKDLINSIEGIIKDSAGNAKYKITGKFTEKIIARSL